jgi:hypothetical protein
MPIPPLDPRAWRKSRALFAHLSVTGNEEPQTRYALTCSFSVGDTGLEPMTSAV